MTETLNSNLVIAAQDIATKTYYCSESDWREFTQFNDTVDFPSSVILIDIKNATEKVKKDAAYMIRWELITKDSEDRYFTQRRFWGNRYDRDDTSVNIINGQITKYDIEVYEVDQTSSLSSYLAIVGPGSRSIVYRIPYEGITEIDDVNGYFKLSSDYPTNSNRQIFVTYWALGKPIEELSYELKMATMEYVTVLNLKRLQTQRLKKGITSYTLGKQSVNRDEATFDKMIDYHLREYNKWINWCRPFIGKRAQIGKMETFNNYRLNNFYY